MTELLKTLNNIRTLRNSTRKLTIEQLEGFVTKLQLIIAEKREAAEKYQYQEQQRRERIEKYKSLLKQDGITAAELAEILDDKQVQLRKKDKPARLNINMSMKTARQEPGPVRDGHQEPSRKH